MPHTVQQLELSLGPLSVAQTLVDDSTGRIVYAPGVVDRPTADAWFAALHAAIDWHGERRPMYDRLVDVPRLMASFAPGAAWPAPLGEAKRVAEAFAGVAFTSVGLNLYRDGNDSVAMHNDHLDELVEGSPVLLISLGSVRRMRIHSKAKPRTSFDVALEPGSVLLMAGAAQRNWEHGVPKTRAAVGPRISLAFRQRPEPSR
jgi:alkylated DNA repair dioxygenase AlkB